MQGVQAQTLANFYLAFEAELAIIPVMNKIDLKAAKPEEVAKQMNTLFDVNPSDILRVCAFASYICSLGTLLPKTPVF